MLQRGGVSERSGDLLDETARRRPFVCHNFDGGVVFEIAINLNRDTYHMLSPLDTLELHGTNLKGRGGCTIVLHDSTVHDPIHHLGVGYRI